MDWDELCQKYAPTWWELVRRNSTVDNVVRFNNHFNSSFSSEEEIDREVIKISSREWNNTKEAFTKLERNLNDWLKLRDSPLMKALR